MLSTELSPALFVAMAVCGGSSTPEPTTPDGWTCHEVKLMVKAELAGTRACSSDWECDQVLEGTGVCPTDDIIINIAEDPGFLLDLLDDADDIGCDMSFTTTGYCPEDAEPACTFSTCSWL